MEYVLLALGVVLGTATFGLVLGWSSRKLDKMSIPPAIELTDFDETLPITALKVGPVYYPDRHGRTRLGQLIAIKGEFGVLHVGHPNHAHFRRPLAELRLVA